MAVFCFIVSGVMAMHYETVLKQFGQSFYTYCLLGQTMLAKQPLQRHFYLLLEGKRQALLDS